MSNPTCSKCPGNPTMQFEKCQPLLNAGGPGQMSSLSKNVTRGGHPLIGLAMMLSGGVAFVANQFAEEAVYKCPNCGGTTTSARWKP